MKFLDEDKLSLIERQMYNKARDIDVAIYNSLVSPECKEFVLDCLMLYMNKDGGFGGGLEIDNYNTNSSVYQTYEAFRILNMLEFDKTCDNELFLEITNKAGNYLFNRNTLENGFWNPVVPSNNNFAHSEKYTYYDNSIEIWNAHPTAAILGFCLNFYNPNKAYYKKAIKMLPNCFAYASEKEVFNYNDCISFNYLLGSLKKNNLFLEEQKMIEEKLIHSFNCNLDDPDFLVSKALFNCNLDENLTNRLNLELDNFIDSIASHGLWEHKDDWNTTIYAEKDSALLKWIGCESVNNFYTLMRNGRIKM